VVAHAFNFSLAENIGIHSSASSPLVVSGSALPVSSSHLAPVRLAKNNRSKTRHITLSTEVIKLKGVTCRNRENRLVLFLHIGF
jgi:hypothetical protein